MRKRYIGLILLAFAILAITGSCADTSVPGDTRAPEMILTDVPPGVVGIVWSEQPEMAPQLTLTVTATRVPFKQYATPGVLGNCHGLSNLEKSYITWVYPAGELITFWGYVEQERGVYTWAGLDNQVATIEAAATAYAPVPKYIWLQVQSNNPGEYRSTMTPTPTGWPTRGTTTPTPELTRYPPVPTWAATAGVLEYPNYAASFSVQQFQTPCPNPSGPGNLLNTYYCNGSKATGLDQTYHDLWEEMVEAFAEKYDNHPLVEAILISAGGNYGEMSQTHPCTYEYMNVDMAWVKTMATAVASKGRAQSPATLISDKPAFTAAWGQTYDFGTYYDYEYSLNVIELAEIYLRHFQSTPIVVQLGSGISCRPIVYQYAMDYLRYYYGKRVWAKQNGWGNSTGASGNPPYSYQYDGYLGSYADGSGGGSDHGKSVYEAGAPAIWCSACSVNQLGTPLAPCMTPGVPTATVTPGGPAVTPPYRVTPSCSLYLPAYSAAHNSWTFENTIQNAKASAACLQSDFFSSRPEVFKYWSATSAPGSAETPAAAYATFAARLAGNYGTYYLPIPEPTGGAPTWTPTNTGEPTNTSAPTNTPTITPTPGGPTNTPTQTPTRTTTPTPTATRYGSVTIDYTDIVDTGISSIAPNTNYGTGTEVAFNDAQYNGLMKFDLSSLPAGSVVTSARLSMVMAFHWQNDNETIQVYAMTRDWNEGEATWNNATAGTEWSSAGGDYDTTVRAELITQDNGWKTLDLTNLVISWQQGTLANYGILIKTSTVVYGGDLTFYSTEYGTVAYRPYLTIDYDAPTATATATATNTGTIPPTDTPTATPTYPSVAYTPAADTYINTAADTISYYTSTQLRGNSAGGLAPLLYFDLSGIPANSTIYDAKMQLYLAAQQNTTDYTSTVKLVLKDVDPNYDTTTWVSYTLATAWDTAGANAATDRSDDSYGSLLVPGAGGVDTWYTVTLTSLIQGWAAGTWPNYGMKIEPGAGDVNYLYWSSVDGANDPTLWVAFATPTPTRMFGVTITDGITQTAPGSVLTYTTSITSNGSYPVDVFNRYTSAIGGTPTGATPAATWEAQYGRYKWTTITANLTPQAFTSIYSVATEVPDGTQLRNQAFVKYASTPSNITYDDTAVVVPTNTPTNTYTPTATPTDTVAPTATPAAQVWINELQPLPLATQDWAGTGVYTDGAFIEIVNLSASEVDLSWARIVVSDTQLVTYTIPYSTTLDAGGFLAFYYRDTKLPLIMQGASGEARLYTWQSNVGGTWSLTLTDSIGIPLTLTPGASYGRYGDGIATPIWMEWPSPGESNTKVTPTPTRTTTYTPTATFTPTATATP